MTDRPTFAMPSVDSERTITLGVLNAVQDDNKVTQRSVAKELGIALGLANTYIKRCIKKGYIKLSKVPPNRYAYYLTPNGFAEKSRLTAEFLSQSFLFFREAREQYAILLADCRARGWSRVAFCGSGDLAEIAGLCNKDIAIDVAAVIDSASDDSEDAALILRQVLSEIAGIDAVIITDLKSPQATFNALAASLPLERILAPKMLGIARSMPALAK